MKGFIEKYYPVFINLYTVWILYMMFFAYGRHHFGDSRYQILSVPFKTIYQLLRYSREYPLDNLTNLFGNIVLFVPYGFLGILYRQLNSYLLLLLVFFIIINILEFSQYYFGRGFAEVDDVILNTFGMSIGYIIYKKFFFIKDK